MSKAPSRAGKAQKPSKDTTKAKPNAEKQPATLFEIVPGKFNENDWNFMLEIDDAQEFIWDLVDEVVENADKIIYSKYIEKQTIPYTINEAKNAILHILDWYFLPMDKNDEDLVEIHLEDEEPEPPCIDSWAQGYIQTFMEEKEEEMLQNEESEEIINEDSKTFLQELSNYIEKQPKESENDFNLNIKESTHLKPKQQKTLSFRQSTFKSKANTIDLTTKSLNLDEIDEKKHHPRYDRLAFDSDIQREPTKNRSKMIESESKRVENSILKAPAACHSILKSLLSRPAGYRELEIDGEGNVISIMKIDSERIPKYNIKPKVTVIENQKFEDEKVKKKKIKGIQIQDEINEKSNDYKISDVSRIIDEEDENNIAKQRKKQRLKKRGDIDEFDYLLEPANGVVYKIGKITRTGPKRGPSNKPSSLLEKFENELKPVRKLSASETRFNSNNNLIDEKLFETNSLKSFNKLKPIPPIQTSNSTHVN